MKIEMTTSHREFVYRHQYEIGSDISEVRAKGLIKMGLAREIEEEVIEHRSEKAVSKRQRRK